MGRNLSNLYISSSYQYLTQVSGSELQDGLGNKITGTLDITASLADTATSASHALNANNAISSSYAITASYALNGGGGSVDTGSLLTTASISDATTTYTKGDGSTFSLTTNNVVNATSASVADTASVVDIQQAGGAGIDYYPTFVETFGVAGAQELKNWTGLKFNDLSGAETLYCLNFSGSLLGNADTATSASYATTASYALNVSTPTLNEVLTAGNTATDESIILTQTDGSSLGGEPTLKTTIGGQNQVRFISTDSTNVISLSTSGSQTAQLSFSGTGAKKITFSTAGEISTTTGDLTLTTTSGKVVASSISASAGFTGSLQGNADTATSASYATTASYALTSVSASHALNADTATSASHALNADNAISSSYAITASYALSAPASSPFPYVGTATITGSLVVSGSALIGASSNTTAGAYSVVLGGTSNTLASNDNSMIVGGNGNNISATSAPMIGIIGGGSNSITTKHNGKGYGTIIVGGYENIIGGSSDSISNFGSSIVGGRGAENNGNFSGIFSTASPAGLKSKIRYGADVNNSIEGATILGGAKQEISGLGLYSSLVGGYGNKVQQKASTIVGGYDNSITDAGTSAGSAYTGSVIVGGRNNLINQKNNSVILGGSNITASADNTTYVPNLSISGSAYSSVYSLAIVSTTASLDCSTGNAFTLTLVDGVDTFVNASNVKAGQTINLQITNSSVGTGTISFSSNIKQPSGGSYSPTGTANAIDVLSMVSFDGTNLLMNSVKNLV